MHRTDYHPLPRPVLRGLVVATVASTALAAASAASALTVSALPGATAGSQVTGVYRIAQTTAAGRMMVTHALVCNGSVKEIHTRNGGSGWLARKAGSTTVKVSTQHFDTLIALAGVDKNVTTLAAAVKNQFLSLCGGSDGASVGSSTGGGSPSLQVAPTGLLQCPSGYEYNKATQKCHLLSSRPLDEGDPRLAERPGAIARWLFALFPASSAQAFMSDLQKRIFVTWHFSNLGGGFHYGYTPVDATAPGIAPSSGVIEVQGGGFQITYLVPASK
jgi:hypothetical protein